MLTKVLKAFEKYDLLGSAGEITLALSGGADSVCLFYVLLELKEKLNFKLSAVHVNHQLRGEESDRDENFVKELCLKHNVPLVVERVDVNRRVAETGESIELAARNLRYEVFCKAASGIIATAHTASDSLETVLYNITRGTGLKGASGIPPKRDNIIRPLIYCTREEIETYLEIKNAEYVTDSSNLADDYTRNKLRHNAVPVLKEINPSVENAVSRMCDGFREDEDFLSLTARQAYVSSLNNNCLDAEFLRSQHPAVIKRVVSIYALEQFGIVLDNLHMEKCLDIIKNSGKVSVVKNLFAICSNNSFLIASDETAESEFSYKTEIIEFIPTKTEKINNLLLKSIIDCDKIIGSVVIRSREQSDSICLAGRKCTKTLKKLFNELKLPLSERDVIPIAADELGVIWVYGVGVSERVKVDDDTVRAKQFVVTKINNHKKLGDVKYDRK